MRDLPSLMDQHKSCFRSFFFGGEEEWGEPIRDPGTCTNLGGTSKDETDDESTGLIVSYIGMLILVYKSKQVVIAVRSMQNRTFILNFFFIVQYWWRGSLNLKK